ncbi:hypothetical protein [Enterococcus faecium]|uniref:hypothetical protein n=1 Tax=Enterococcus faecium TaxID=1352 RepID=UPI00295E9D60|nr:hypothetical protein [Enterococcus faecium]EME8091030.1 hypothetical protein [Enterococcus faecium]WOV46820.1 hypothetical protein R5U33_06150 [Enterococcus faecium]
MKDYFKNNTLTVLVFILSIGSIGIIVGIDFFGDKVFIKDSFKKEDLYNLLTINTIFSGFLYTMLGNLVEFTSREEMRKKDLAGYVDKYYSPVYFGLAYFILAILIEVCILFFGFSILLGYLILLQKILSFFGIIYFVISTIMLRKIIVQIRTNN